MPELKHTTFIPIRSDQDRHSSEVTHLPLQRCIGTYGDIVSCQAEEQGLVLDDAFDSAGGRGAGARQCVGRAAIQSFNQGIPGCTCIEAAAKRLVGQLAGFEDRCAEGRCFGRVCCYECVDGEGTGGLQRLVSDFGTQVCAGISCVPRRRW